VPKSLQPFDIDVALLCDDVRREVTGKDIIIGVYGEELTTPHLPTTFIFTLYMRVRFPIPNSDYPVEFRVIGPSDVQLTTAAKSNLRSPPPGGAPTSTVSLGGIPFQIQTPGLVQFQWRPAGADWKTIARLEIKQGAVSGTPGIFFNPVTTA
jgi:hypothetical protein